MADVGDCAPYDNGNLIDAWEAGEFLNGIICPYDLQLGPLVFGLLVYGGIMTGIYVRTQSLTLPMAVTVIGGTVAVSQIPSQAVQVMVIAIVLGGTAGLYLFTRRFRQ